MNTKLRLIIWTDCRRSCPGCCNNDWAMDDLPECTDFSPFTEILLTGGEPLLYPFKLCGIIDRLRVLNSMAKIYVYTAWLYRAAYVRAVLEKADGITATLHEQSDVWAFYAFAEYYESYPFLRHKSLRLNVFQGVDVGVIPARWNIKRNMTFQRNCPLPEGEVLMRIPYALQG